MKKLIKQKHLKFKKGQSYFIKIDKFLIEVSPNKNNFDFFFISKTFCFRINNLSKKQILSLSSDL
jgi:hypothetical protein